MPNLNFHATYFHFPEGEFHGLISILQKCKKLDFVESTGEYSV